MTPRIGSLCSGYGGLELGLMAVVGGSVAWHVEHDKHPSAVLEARFPGVPNYGDVTTTDWTLVEPVDWLTAGYPCQPFSPAGKRKGSADERHLWPAVADAVGVLRPRRVLLENVAGHLSLGLDTVLADLASLGYDSTWGVVRASDAGAPHERERVFVVAADTTGQRHERPRAPRRGRLGLADGDHAAPDAHPAEQPREHAQLDGPPAAARSGGDAWGPYRAAVDRWSTILGRPAPSPTQRTGTGERLNARLVEWMQGLPDGWVTDVLPRRPAIKALGNGVVPQQAALAVRTLLTVGNVAA